MRPLFTFGIIYNSLTLRISLNIDDELFLNLSRWPKNKINKLHDTKTNIYIFN